MTTCPGLDGLPCKRERIPTVNGLVRAYCPDHERLALHEAFGARCQGTRLGCTHRVGWPCTVIDCPDRAGAHRVS